MTPTPSQFFRSTGQAAAFVFLLSSAALFSAPQAQAQGQMSDGTVDSATTPDTSQWMSNTDLATALAGNDGITASTGLSNDWVGVSFSNFPQAAGTRVWRLEVVVDQRVAGDAASNEDDWMVQIFHGDLPAPAAQETRPGTTGFELATFEFSDDEGIDWTVGTVNNLRASLSAVLNAPLDSFHEVDQIILQAEINVPPVANSGTVTVGQFVTVSGALSATDPNALSGDTNLVFSLVSGSQNGGTVNVFPGGSFSYRSAANFEGPDSFTFRVCDDGGAGLCSTAMQTINVVHVNQPPTFSLLTTTLTVDEDASGTGMHTVTGFAFSISAGTATETAQQSVTFSVAFTATAGLFVSPPAVNSQGTLLFRTATDANGLATVSLAAVDNGGTANGGQNRSPTRSFTLTVNPVDDPVDLIVIPSAPSGNEDAPLSFGVGCNDPDGGAGSPTCTFLILSQPSHGVATLTVQSPILASVSYLAAANYFGTDSLVISMSNGAAAVTKAVVLTVNPVADSPVADAGADQNVAPLSRVTLDASASLDPDLHATSLTFLWQMTGPSGVTVTLSSTASAQPAFTAPANAGTAALTLSFLLTVTDPTARSDTDSVQVFVRPPLTANGKTVSTSEETPVVVTLSAIGVGALSFALGANPAHGAVTGSGATRTYIPATDFFGTDSFVFIVTDSLGGASASAIVTISVAGVNDAPVASLAAAAVVDAGALVTLSGSVRDVDSVTLTYQWTQLSGTSVSLSNRAATLTAAAGTLVSFSATFTAPELAVGANTTLVFQLVARDGLLPATRSLTVTAQNGDGDLDSVPDASDNCPAVGNRNQLDSDGDGKGNLCDDTPLPVTTSSSSSSATDTGGTVGEVLPPMAFGAGLLLAIATAVLLGLGVVLVGRGGF